MENKRFLRDGVIDSMIQHICDISGSYTEEGSVVVCSQSFESITELYESNKIALKYLESLIEESHEEMEIDDLIDQVVEAATQIQQGCPSTYSSLQGSLNNYIRVIRSD